MKTKNNRTIIKFICAIAFCICMSICMTMNNVHASGKPNSEDGLWEYWQMQDGILLFEYYGDKNVENITIPDEVDGQTVTQIGSNVFAGNTSIVNVVLPSTLVETPRFKDCTNLKSVKSDTGEFPYMKSIPDSSFDNCTSLETFDIPESVETIGAYAFNDCSSYTKDIVTNATKVGQKAFANTGMSSIRFQGQDPLIGDGWIFAGCPNLESVFIANMEELSAVMFSAQKSIQSVEVESGLLRIKERCFENCTNLEAVILPDTCEIIEKQAFYRCTKMNLDMDFRSMTEIGESAFEGCGALQKVVSTSNTASIHISKHAFKECKGLEDFPFLFIEEYGEYSFADCSSLTSVEINKDLKEIAKGTFSGCTGITSVIIPEDTKLEKIGDSAFSRCSMTQFVLPETLRYVGDAAFFGCNSLKGLTCNTLPNIEYFGAFNINKYWAETESFTTREDNSVIIGGTVLALLRVKSGQPVTYKEVPEGVRVIAGEAFNGIDIQEVKLPSTLISIGTEAFSRTKITSIKLPDGVKMIGNNAFDKCDYLESVEMTDSVTNLGEYAFQFCKNLKEVRLSNRLEVIEEGTFSGCEKLETIHMPTALKELQRHAFANCVSLTEMVLPEGIEVIDGNPFYGCSGIKELEVPASVQSYPWLYEIADETGVERLIVHENNVAESVIKDHEMDITVLHENSNGVRVIFSDDTATVVEYVGEEKQIALPSKVSGMSVKSVVAGAVDCSSCKSLYIPDSVIEIEEGAFVGLSKDCKIIASKDSYAAKWAAEQGLVVESNKLVTSIYIKEDTVYLKILSGNNHDEVQVHATAYPVDATETAIEWSVENPDLFEITQDGRLRIKQGASPVTGREYIVRASAIDRSGVSSTCKVVVYDSNSYKPNKVTLKDATVKVGDTVELKPVFEPEDAQATGLNWTCSDETVALVKGGVVTGLKKGTVTITATSPLNSDVTATCKVTVTGDEVIDPSKENPEDGKKPSGGKDDGNGTGNGIGNGTGNGTVTTPTDVANNSVGKVKSFKITAKKKALKLTWKKMSKIKGYQIQVSTKKNFKKKYTKKYTAKASAKSKTIKKLKAKKKYYVRIRAYKKVGSKSVYGAWVKASKKTK